MSMYGITEIADKVMWILIAVSIERLVERLLNRRFIRHVIVRAYWNSPMLWPRPNRNDPVDLIRHRLELQGFLKDAESFLSSENQGPPNTLKIARSLGNELMTTAIAYYQGPTGRVAFACIGVAVPNIAVSADYFHGDHPWLGIAQILPALTCILVAWEARDDGVKPAMRALSLCVGGTVSILLGFVISVSWPDLLDKTTGWEIMAAGFGTCLCGLGVALSSKPIERLAAVLVTTGLLISGLEDLASPIVPGVPQYDQWAIACSGVFCALLSIQFLHIVRGKQTMLLRQLSGSGGK